MFEEDIIFLKRVFNLNHIKSSPFEFLGELLLILVTTIWRIICYSFIPVLIYIAIVGQREQNAPKSKSDYRGLNITSKVDSVSKY